MSFVPGTRLGPYEITAQIGVGGMGEVYRASDTNLKRAVAIKVLPDALACDAERLARFRREAEVLASLNHPNVAAIYGLERTDTKTALVMELVEGPTLADRIAQGPMPIDEVLPIAKQIAEALEVAHELAIIHRDLKPANIKLRPDGVVKLLDFGLAKALEPAGAMSPSVTQSPTITSAGMTTGVGVLLGTAAYMSPEQARGHSADKRVDIWSFGCVLYEMCTGNQPFDGENVTDILAAVLRAEPDWQALPGDIPLAVRTLMRRCLEKDRRKRIPDISTVRFVIDTPDLLPGPTLSQPASRRFALAALFGLIAAGALGFALWNTTPTASPSRSVVRFVIPVPQGQNLAGNTGLPLLNLSPDGQHLVYAEVGGLYLRSMSDATPRRIPGTEGNPESPVFSPDGQSIAFFIRTDQGGTTPGGLARGLIKRVRLTGGTPETVCETAYPLGISWGADGLVFGQTVKGVMRVSEGGGEPELLVPVNEDEIAVGPQVLPGGRAVLFTHASDGTNLMRPQETVSVDRVSVDAWNKARVVVQSLETGERTTLIEGGSDGRYVPTGHIVYAVGGTLRVVPFDINRLAVTGAAAPLIEGVARTRYGSLFTGSAHFSTSAAGALAYISGPVSASPPPRDLALYDRSGGIETLNLPPMLYESPRVSPNGQEVAVSTTDVSNTNVWVYDLSRKSPLRQLTFQSKNRYPVWSADGDRIAFQSDRDGDLAIFAQPADGSGPAERLTKPERKTAHVPLAWSPNGEYMLFSVETGSDFSLWTFAARDKKVESFAEVRSSTVPPAARFSPDGRWVAYHSGETPHAKVFVRSFPATSAMYQVPVDAGHPRWSADGTQLFFGQGPRIFVVGINSQPKFAFGTPTLLVQGIPLGAGGYDVVAGGTRFVGITVAPGHTPISAAAIRQIDVVLNWPEGLKTRVATVK